MIKPGKSGTGRKQKPRSAQTDGPRRKNAKGSARARPSLWRLQARAQLQSDGRPDQGFLVDTYTATVSVSNGTAWMLLNRLKSGASLEQLVDQVIGKYRTKRQAARADILIFLTQLRRIGLVEGHE